MIVCRHLGVDGRNGNTELERREESRVRDDGVPSSRAMIRRRRHKVLRGPPANAFDARGES